MDLLKTVLFKPHKRPAKSISAPRAGAKAWHTLTVTNVVLERQVVYDVDDDNALIHFREGVPHADLASIDGQALSRFSGHPSSSVHNPYGCFGAPGVAWPRGYPLSAIQDDSPAACEVVGVDGTSAPRIGVVQALANHDPDVDAIYRLTHPPGGLPFGFTQEAPLRGVPAEKMTPYNAQVTKPPAISPPTFYQGPWLIDLRKVLGASARSEAMPRGKESCEDQAYVNVRRYTCRVETIQQTPFFLHLS